MEPPAPFPLYEASFALACLLLALSLRPWHMLRGSGQALLTPLLASLAVLPWLWALPRLHQMPMQLPWSGACLVLLMLGWPLAVPTLVLVALAALWLTGAGWQEGLDMLVWQGLLPATFAVLIGAAIRRMLGTHLFVYVIGRCFLGTVLSLFLGSLWAYAQGRRLAGVEGSLSLVGHWLTAWGDGFVTGMLCAVFVAFRPQWLATWSDRFIAPAR
ncbi:hypothetical protein D8I35_00320 [Corticibacter populi]|uniref:Energy-coupling factor ABC transporter permease n=1 Tax=Corticibacter populi TaxID=1550736 RepID=A0A3M6QYP1_9BURK|nr:hypothetical protein [Corticibacter populi]RMX07632.1 hypothetical protein D8I35_00320 [Corticibacter populi]RZS30133.1 putative membrane protein [Corticibacter populi]